VVVLPGVEIGAGCVIAAGSVVVKNTEPDGLYAGVPATRKKELDDNPAKETPLIILAIQ
jgi:acetyltransferase-like isoleucine patch superfamily enzyme